MKTHWFKMIKTVRSLLGLYNQVSRMTSQLRKDQLLYNKNRSTIKNAKTPSELLKSQKRHYSVLARCRHPYLLNRTVTDLVGQNRCFSESARNAEKEGKSDKKLNSNGGKEHEKNEETEETEEKCEKDEKDKNNQNSKKQDGDEKQKTKNGERKTNSGNKKFFFKFKIGERTIQLTGWQVALISWFPLIVLLWNSESFLNNFRGIAEVEAVFENELKKGKVEFVDLYAKHAVIAVSRGPAGFQKTIVSFDDAASFEKQLNDAQAKHGLKVEEYVPVNYYEVVNKRKESRSKSISELINMAFIGLIVYGIFFSKGGKIYELPFSFGSNMMKADTQKISTRLKDVAGLRNVKREIIELSEFLTNKNKFNSLGAKVPRGALLIGPPGTGKTLMAKAIAGEAGCSFFTACGSDFKVMFVGAGSMKVRKLFKNARENAPSIIFIDEIDAVGKQRDSNSGEDSRTLNQILVEMDGFKSNDNVIVLAGTNRVEMLDSALTRSGRFDRKIYFDLPDIKEREEIYEVHLKNIKLEDPIELVSRRMAALTPGFSGADIANVCNEGAIVASRKNRKSVTQKDLESALDRVLAGIKKEKSTLSEKERRVIAFHESGHAVAAWFLEHANPLLKVTIAPRSGGALGFSQYLPKELSIYTLEQLKASLCVSLGGRVSEMIFSGRLSSGAVDDLQKVSDLAYRCVREFGMSSKIGNLAFPDQGQFQPTIYSDGTAFEIDEEVRIMVAEAYEATENLIKEKMEYVTKLADELIKRETLNHKDLVEILGKRPYKSYQYENYLSEIKKYRNETANEKMQTEEKTAESTAENKNVKGKSEINEKVKHGKEQKLYNEEKIAREKIASGKIAMEKKSDNNDTAEGEKSN